MDNDFGAKISELSINDKCGVDDKPTENHQDFKELDNLCYAYEYTHELVPLKKHEAKKLAELCEYVKIDVTKESLKPLKGESTKKKEKELNKH